MNTPTSVYAEMTPNPEVMKFVADRPLIEGNAQAEFTSKADCAGHSSFAEELFNFPFVTGVFISGSFVSVTKDDTIGWEMIAMQMREYIQQWLTEHPVAVEQVPPPKAANPMPEAAPTVGEPVVTLKLNWMPQEEVILSAVRDLLHHRFQLLISYLKRKLETRHGWRASASNACNTHCVDDSFTCICCV